MGRVPDPEMWRGRRVLVTGHTGFKGSWLCAWLEALEADVMGVSLPDPTSVPALWEELELEGLADVRADITGFAWQEQVIDFAPSVVFHLAAQSLVSHGYNDPRRTFSTNVQGTAQVLHTMSDLTSVDVALMITTDKVYDTRQRQPFTEDDYLGGRDPYSASKASMELLVHSWPTMHAAVATARAGNVIGGGDWSEDRLVPDLVRAWSAASPLMLRNPDAVRPWQHVLEPLRGYLLYAEHLVEHRGSARALNLGPDVAQCVAVDELVQFAAKHWAHDGPDRDGPIWTPLPHPPMVETGELAIDSTRATQLIGWTNTWGWQETLRRTLDWYLDHARGSDARTLVRRDLAEYYAALGAEAAWIH